MMRSGIFIFLALLPFSIPLDHEEAAVGRGGWLLISTYSTSFHPGDLARNHNIALAAAKLNGALIGAGEIFSFNRKIGERTAEAGYLKAPYLEGGIKINVNGGGVCLVSSVLYDAALLAEDSNRQAIFLARAGRRRHNCLHAG